MINNLFASYELFTSLAVLLIMGPIVYLIGKKSSRVARWLAFLTAAITAVLMIHVGIILLDPYAVSVTLTLNPTTWTYSFIYATQMFPYALQLNVQLYPFTTSLNTIPWVWNSFDRAVSNPLYILYNVIPNGPYMLASPFHS